MFFKAFHFILLSPNTYSYMTARHDFILHIFNFNSEINKGNDYQQELIYRDKTLGKTSLGIPTLPNRHAKKDGYKVDVCSYHKLCISLYYI